MSEQIPDNAPSLPSNIDEAIHHCILALESDDEPAIQDLMQRCPQWREELEDFLANWGGMEQIAEQVGSGVESVAENESGIQVGDYQLIEQIGSGGMGVIYKAHQLSLDRMVALKMINRDQTDRDRFQVEAEAIAALTHSNIVQVYEIGEHAGRMFFSMQLIEGCNLKEYRKQTTVRPEDAAAITKRVAMAVHYAHQRGILHRDLKPANVLMDVDGEPHITDFGLAKQMGRDHDLTVSGAIIGTPAYMAPEQAAGQAKNLTVATDVYGLGAILYALITGQAPFTGESSLEIIRKVVDQPPSSPRIHNSDVGRDLETICLKCLEKAPELRYASAAELADDLELFLSGQPVNARPVPQLERVWRWCLRNPIVSVLMLAVVALLISTTVTAIFLAASERRARIDSEQNDRHRKSLEFDIEQQKLAKQNALLLADQNKTTLFLSNGQRNLRDGNLPESLLWYAHVAQRLDAETEAYQENLVRCKSIFNNVAVPIYAVQLNSNYHDLEWGFDDFVELDSRGNRALIQVGDRFHVWDCTSGHVTELNRDFPAITCARFCSSAERLLVGCRDDKCIFADASTLEVEREFEIEGAVSGVSVSANGQLVAVESGHTVAFWDSDFDRFIEPKLIFDTAVEHVTFNEQGDRAIVVYQNKNGKPDKTGRLAAFADLLAIEKNSISSVAKIPCRVMKRQHFRYPNRRPFWPLFVQAGQSIMIRNEATRIHFYNAIDGQLIRFFYSEPGDFAYSASSTGEYYATGKKEMASIRRVLHSPPVPDQPSKRKEFMRLIHDGQVVEAIVGPNNLIATCNRDGVVKLWHIHRSQFSKPCDDVPWVFDQNDCLCEIPHQGVVRRMVFSDEGSQLITIQNDGLVRVWSLPDYAEHIQEVAVSRGGALAKLVSDNEWIISGLTKSTGHVGNVRSFDIDSGRQVTGTAGPQSLENFQFLDSEVSPTHELLISVHASASRDPNGTTDDAEAGHVQFWSYPECEPLTDEIPLSTEPRSVAFGPAGKRVAIATAHMLVHVFDTTSFELVTTLNPGEKTVSALAGFSAMPDDKFNGQVAFRPNGKQLMVWGCGDKLWVWNVKNEVLNFPVIDNLGQKVESAEYSNDGKFISVALGRSGIARVYDADTGATIGEDLRHDSAVVSARFDQAGTRLVTACQDGKARIFDVASGRQSELLLSHDSELVDACFTPNSRFAVTLDSDQNLYVWNLRGGDLAMPPVRVPQAASQILVSADSKRIVVGGGLRRMFVLKLDQLYESEIQDGELKWMSTVVSGKRLNDESAQLLSSKEWFEVWRSHRTADSSRVSDGD